MIKQIDSLIAISIQDLSADGVKVTYSPQLSLIKSEMIKLSKAVLRFDLNKAPTETCKVFFSDLQSGNEYIIDEFSANNTKVCIDITDELQDCLFSKKTFSLRISGLSANSIISESREAILEYYFKKQTIKDQAIHNFDVGKAGNGEINLATGVFKFAFEDVATSSKVLPISVTHSYNSLDAGKASQIVPYFDEFKTLPENNCGKGWKTNFNQYIVKEPKADGIHSDKETSARFTYVNADGEFILFEEKYYIKDSDGNKSFIESNKVHINLDGDLEYVDNLGNSQEAFKETVSDSGINLITKYENLQGVSLLTQDSEDISNLKEDIKSINKTLKEMNLQKENNLKAVELLNLSSEMSRLNQDSQKINLENEETEINLQNQSKEINQQYKSLYKEYSRLVDERSYMFKGTPVDKNAKVAYPTDTISF